MESDYGIEFNLYDVDDSDVDEKELEKVAMKPKSSSTRQETISQQPTAALVSVERRPLVPHSSSSSSSSSSDSSFSSSESDATNQEKEKPPYKRNALIDLSAHCPPSNNNNNNHSTTKRKFVGGAQNVRRKARKKGRPLQRPGISDLQQQETKKQKQQRMPKGCFERFFWSLLSSTVCDYLQTPERIHWRQVCERLTLEVPQEPLLDCYQHQPHLHFRHRTALVLEEARHQVTEALKRTYSRPSARRGLPVSVSLSSSNNHNNKQNNSLIVKASLTMERKPTKGEQYCLRPGSVFQMVPSRQRVLQPQVAVLGLVVSGKSSSSSESSTFLAMFFTGETGDLLLMEQPEILFVTQLITQCRSFEALHVPQVHFLSALLGQKMQAPTHTRWVDHSDNEQQHCIVSKGGYKRPDEGSDSSIDNFFNVPLLNAVQEQAASKFLNSLPNTISLVQGPPGTGKTTLLTNVICRYLDKSKRLLVCGPTNKAVTVLANRYLNSIRSDSPCPFNAILVGDAEKLLQEQQNRGLYHMFLYSWMSAITDGYRRVLNFRKESLQSLLRLAKHLESKLIRSLPYLGKVVTNDTAAIVSRLETLYKNKKASHNLAMVTNRLIRNLKELQPETVWAQLLKSADVIFCTLASAGSMIMRKTSPINDLIIDEAAAATEPELYIPLHLKPRRMLAVGDPLQLPATVLSQTAVSLGLSKSLHERLMYSCDFEYTMLNIQYRMSQQISAFPDVRFYKNQIQNGPNVSSHFYLNSPRLLDKLPYVFCQVDGREEQNSDGSYRNHAEAKKIVDLVQELKQTTRQNKQGWASADRLRVITYYQAQVALIKKKLAQRGLHSVVVATVDSSQGCEADTVLISFVRSGFQPGFLTDNRRLNVSLTRAKHQLVLCANVNNFSRMQGADTLRALATDAQRRGLVRTPFTKDVSAQLDLFYGPATESSH